MSADGDDQAETPEDAKSHSDDEQSSETPEDAKSHSDGDDEKGAETPELSDEGKKQVEEMTQAYDDDRETAVLPGTDGTITGVAINEWLDDDGNPKFGKDKQDKKDGDDEPRDDTTHQDQDQDQDHDDDKQDKKDGDDESRDDTTHEDRDQDHDQDQDDDKQHEDTAEKQTEDAS